MNYSSHRNVSEKMYTIAREKNARGESKLVAVVYFTALYCLHGIHQWRIVVCISKEANK